MQKFDTPAPVSVVLDVPAGRIQFIAAERADTTVEVRPANAGSGRDVKAAERTTVAYGEGVLRIEAPPAKNRVLGQCGAVEVTVQLPAGSRVEAKTAAGELRGVGRLGEVTLEAAQGAIKLDETAGARLTLLAGDICVGRLTGSADISTGKGDIRITEATHGTLTLRTQAGDLSIGAARGVAATLDAGTTHGRIHNTLNNTPGNPDGATVSLAVHATTAYGNITARSL